MSAEAGPAAVASMPAAAAAPTNHFIRRIFAFLSSHPTGVDLAELAVMRGQERADGLEVFFGFFEMGRVTGVLEDLPARALDPVGIGLHRRRRRLVVAPGNDQGRGRYPVEPI